eukprot:GHVR01045895.1.p1 GENE.GHVR01045895.1~~GHVR01045895.1.p1  ORF type:complete len:169 (+),score=12.56 GHVR01045895.1:282-788(+)
MNPNGVCRGCACVKAKRACTSCRPGKAGRCCNSSLLSTHDGAIPSNNSEIFGLESTNHLSATICPPHSPPTQRYTPKDRKSVKSRIAPTEKENENTENSHIYRRKHRCDEDCISADINPPGLDIYAHLGVIREDYISADVGPLGLDTYAHADIIREDYISVDVIPHVL